MQHILIGTMVATSVLGVMVSQIAPNGSDGFISNYEKLGALGLLGLIVVLIFVRYLPSKDKQSTDQTTAFTECISSITKAHNDAIKEQRDSFKATIGTVCNEFREANERHSNLCIDIVGKCRANGND